MAKSNKFVYFFGGKKAEGNLKLKNLLGGKGAGLADMVPHSETRHCPSVDIRYALEVRQGGFQRRGITLHAQVNGLPE